MITDIVYIIAGIALGLVAGMIIANLRAKATLVPRTDLDKLNEKYNQLNNELSTEKEKSKNLGDALNEKETTLKTLTEDYNKTTGLLAGKTAEHRGLAAQYEELKTEFAHSKTASETLQSNIQELNKILSASKANLDAANGLIKTYTEDITQLKLEVRNRTDALNETAQKAAELNAVADGANAALKIHAADIAKLKEEVKAQTDAYNTANKKAAELGAVNDALNEKLNTQKTEMEGLRKQFNTEFENIATKILEEKSKKFTDLNRDNLDILLKPLGDNIKSFKEKVEEVYDKESKERFSLGKEVEKLVLANQKISEEANNLTNALVSNSKSQGDWGQMILETILEKSGLVKDREYLVQEFLKDENDNYIVNELGTKMQPDVIVNYPDNRKVIIDAKVSLTAYTRYTATSIKEDEKKALAEHLRSIRRHIDDLSAKSYQDFAPSLDFVMMFVPVEPAYLIAVHTDQDLWNYAYKKRILLTSPSNLIVALKMIVDLWKKDNQSKNYQAIVERGGKLYDKFANVLESLQDIGANLVATQKSYNTTINRLSEGNDNVIKQVEKLKSLGANAKKTLPEADSLLLLNIGNDAGTALNEN